MQMFFHQRKKSITLLFHLYYWHNQNSILSIGRNFQHENSVPFNDPFLVLKLHCQRPGSTKWLKRSICMWVDILLALRASDVGSSLHKNPSGTRLTRVHCIYYSNLFSFFLFFFSFFISSPLLFSTSFASGIEQFNFIDTDKYL